jgi:hypothetical protein
VTRDAGCTAGPCMYRDRYFESERLLAGVLGAEDADGAGGGIVSDVRLALAEAEKRGAVKALGSAAEVAKRSAAEVAAATGAPLAEGVILALAQVIKEYADQIKSGEVL